MLDADIQLRLSRLNLDTAFTVASGEVLALLGPNGSGKSTTLRALVGLLPLAGGRIVLDGTVLEDPAQRIKIPPEQRPINLMFQDYLLFPHLSAIENVAFGLRAKGTDKKAARDKASETMARLGLDGLAEAKPGSMSGGQQQRVAMARALVTDPKLLLLDEPLAALDVSTKTDVRRLLREVLRESVAANVLVTHDLLDAVALGDRMVVIGDGKIVQTGTPAEVTSRPRSRYVADLVGVNLLRGTAGGHQVRLPSGGTIVTADEVDGDVYVAIQPHAVSLHRAEPEGSPRNVWQGSVNGTDLLGDRVRIHIDGPVPLVAEVTIAAVGELGLRDGVDVFAAVKATEVSTYPA